jgi:hypothetical protein
MSYETEYRKTRAKALKANTKTLFAFMKEKRVVMITIPYDGSHDEGSIGRWMIACPSDHIDADVEEITMIRVRGTELTEAIVKLSEFLKVIALTVLTHHYEGWQNDLGSKGEIVLQTENETIEVVRNIPSITYTTFTDKL